MFKAHTLSILLGLMALPLAAGGPGKAHPKTPARPVDLNAATVTELMQLPKVGAHTAQRIVQWRKEHGPFRRPEEVMHVKGIGEKGFQRLRPFLQVGGGGSVGLAAAPGVKAVRPVTARPSTAHRSPSRSTGAHAVARSK